MSTIQGIDRTTAVHVPATGSTDSGGAAAPDATSLMPPPGCFGLGESAMTALAVLLVQADNQDRDMSRTVENAADKAALDDANQHADKLRDKANQDLNQAWASGGLQLAGGLATGASAFASSPRLQGVLNGAKDGLPAAGTVLAGGFKANADRDDADGVKLDAQAQSHIRGFNTAHDDSEAAAQSIQKVEQFLQSVVQAENETRNVAASMLRG